MSDALKYLMQVRPEAMENYFSFIRKSGEHLDDRTKAIISVITKVDRQTERGFRQYLKRALDCGVSPDEIIDALFLAFPTLGLSKLVWAAEILLEMDLPEFDPEKLQGGPGWHHVAADEDLHAGVNYIDDCDGRSLFIYRDGTEVRVYDSICPHQSTDIPREALVGTCLTCPKHHWKFDLTSGRCLGPGDRPLRRFDNKLENGRLMALW